MSFPRYGSYKDSGVEWLGEVPSDWSVKPLKREARLVTERASTRFRPLGLENIEGWSGRLFETDTDFEGEGIAFRPGDVLYGKLRPYLAKVYATDFAGEAVGDFHVIRPAATTLARFLSYLLLTRELVSILDGSTFGAKMPRVGWEFLGALKVAFPTLSEQSAITDFLDRETAKIDALVEAQRRLIALLKEKRQAVISHAVTKGLDRSAPLKPSGIDWLGDVPAHWEVKPLMWLTAPGRDIMYGIVLPGPDVGEGVRIVKGGDVKASRLKPSSLCCTTPEIEAPFARARLREDDIVYSIRGSIGDAELVPANLVGANITQDVARISPDHTRANALWLLHVMRSNPIFVQLEQGSLGAAVRGINIFDLKRARVPAPPVEEQDAIGKWLDLEVANFEQLITEAQKSLTLLAERPHRPDLRRRYRQDRRAGVGGGGRTQRRGGRDRAFCMPATAPSAGCRTKSSSTSPRHTRA